MKISKVYGPMWQEIEKQQKFRINIKNLIRGTSKDFVFEIQMPIFPKNIDKELKNPQVIYATMTMLGNRK